MSVLLTERNRIEWGGRKRFDGRRDTPLKQEKTWNGRRESYASREGDNRSGGEGRAHSPESDIL